MKQWTPQELQELKQKRLLIIVESPNKVKTISNILTTAGYTKAVVMASVGHISNIKDTRGSYKNTGIYPTDNFRMNLVVSDDKKQVVQKLKEQADIADFIFVMTDPDREGAQIAWSLIHFLKLAPNKFYRAVTHEITANAVIYAITHPIDLETDLVEAAQTRMILDKLVGYSLSPVAKTYLGARSVGRCQSAGLKLIVDREKEINEFVPESYFDLYLSFIKNNQNFKAKYIGTDEKTVNKILSLGKLNAIKFKCSDQFIVKDIIEKERLEAPKPPFCTASFQQEVNTKLGLGVKEAMAYAQKLFEGININGNHVGLITYHRTDSTTISPEFIPILSAYVNNSLNMTFTLPRSGKKTGIEQDGHECLRCVNPELTPEELAKYTTNNLLIKVYKLIWQRTIASVLPNAKISETNYYIYNNDQKFILTSQRLVEEGYRIIYQYSSEPEQVVQENFMLQEILQNCQLEHVAKQTQPPARYREATFIKELQNKGIGRPSTFAGILETVVSSSRGYCTIVDKQLVPTERGIQLSNFLDRAFSSIISINYTREMEQQLDLIASGKLLKLDFLNTFYNELELAIKQNKEVIGEPPSSTKQCPKCGSPMVIRRSRFGKLFYGCSNYPACNGILNMN